MLYNSYSILIIITGKVVKEKVCFVLTFMQNLIMIQIIIIITAVHPGEMHIVYNKKLSQLMQYGCLK
jgi:hypothetical protein